jgi:hypothetical protein
MVGTTWIAKPLRLGLSAGTLAAAFGGLDAFVFTAGIGENSTMIRSRVAEKLAWLGALCDPVSSGGTFPAPLEELMIARQYADAARWSHHRAHLNRRSSGVCSFAN